MRLVFVCHASRLKSSDIPDRDSPLTDAGEAAACECGEALVSRGITPQVFFTSWYTRAKQTADILRVTTAAFRARVVELCTLTPTFPGQRGRLNEREWAGQPILSWISSEADKCESPLEELHTAVFVMHQPRLAQRLRAMTPGAVPKYDDLRHPEGVCLRADALQAFLEGKGMEDGCWFRRRYIEAEIGRHIDHRCCLPDGLLEIVSKTSVFETRRVCEA